MKRLELLESISENVELQADKTNYTHLLLAHITFNNTLDLSACLLHPLPSTLFSHVHLTVSNLLSIDLSKNQLKEVPVSIGELPNLEVLDLQSNQLCKLPSAIGLLHRLRTLNVSGNMLVFLPQSLAGCRMLVELNVGFNQLECLPLRIGHELVSLERLSVHSNKLTFLPPSICHLRQLKVLDVHFNKLKSLPLAMGNMRALERLNISNNFSDFGGDLPYSFGDMTSLIELDLSSNQVRVLPDSIGALPNIKTLKVGNNPLVIPPIEVVEHSMEAMLKYMGERWKVSQDLDDTSKSLSHSRVSCARRSGSWLPSFLAGGCAGRPA